jgi:hypothetical protein
LDTFDFATEAPTASTAPATVAATTRSLVFSCEEIASPHNKLRQHGGESRIATAVVPTTDTTTTTTITSTAALGGLKKLFLFLALALEGPHASKKAREFSLDV